MVVCVDPAAVKLPGAVGGIVSGGGVPPTGVLMSVWISLVESARLYTRTSSMTPAKYSPQTELPPIRSGAVEETMLPVSARELTCTPFT